LERPIGNKNVNQARLWKWYVVCYLSHGVLRVLDRLRRQGMKGIVYPFQECRSPRHEGIPKAAEICTITHFFGEYIRRIASATDVFDRNCFIRDPFTCSVLSVLDMTITFRREIVTPFYASFVVVVQWRRLVCIGYGVTKRCEMENSITDIDSETRTHICSSDFCLTQTERSTVLTVRFSGNRATRSKDNGTTHAEEFK